MFPRVNPFLYGPEIRLDPYGVNTQKLHNVTTNGTQSLYYKIRVPINFQNLIMDIGCKHIYIEESFKSALLLTSTQNEIKENPTTRQQEIFSIRSILRRLSSVSLDAYCVLI